MPTPTRLPVAEVFSAYIQRTGFLEFITLLDAGKKIMPLFLSPVDANLTAMMSATTPLSTRVISVLRIAADDSPPPCLFMAWQAHSGQLMLDDNGRLKPCVVDMPTESEDPGFVNLRPDQTSLHAFDLIRQLAGLYAWAETANTFFSWPLQRQTEALKRSQETVMAGTSDPVQADQFAVFDPERMQWHFIDIAALEQAAERIRFSPSWS